MKLVFVREPNTAFSLEELSNFHKEANSVSKSAEGIIAPKEFMERLRNTTHLACIYVSTLG